MAAGELKPTPTRARRKAARKRSERKVVAGQRCLAGDGNAAHARGLCQTCYRDALSQVAAGETTWEEIESAGLAKPKYGRRSKSAFSDRFTRPKKNGRK